MLPFVKKRDLLEPNRSCFRVWPNDCDVNLHMNNGRYLTFMDLARVNLIVQIGLMRLLFRKRWAPIVAAAEMNFIRPIRPFSVFEIVSRVLTWDDKYFYIQQRFEVGGRLAAVGMIKGLFLWRGKPVPMNEILDAMNLPNTPPTQPSVVRHWNELSELKRQQSDVFQ